HVRCRRPVKSIVQLDCRELLRVIREHVFSRKTLRIKTPLPFLITVAARADVKTHKIISDLRIQYLCLLCFFVAKKYGTQAHMSTVTNIESVLHEERLFPPPENFSELAHIKSMDDLEALRAEAAADPEAFWARMAEELHWFKSWDTVLKWNPPH